MSSKTGDTKTYQRKSRKLDNKSERKTEMAKDNEEADAQREHVEDASDGPQQTHVSMTPESATVKKRKARGELNEPEMEEGNMNKEANADPQQAPTYEKEQEQQQRHEIEHEDDPNVNRVAEAAPARKRSSRRLRKEVQNQQKKSNNQQREDAQVEIDDETNEHEGNDIASEAAHFQAAPPRKRSSQRLINEVQKQKKKSTNEQREDAHVEIEDDTYEDEGNDIASEAAHVQANISEPEPVLGKKKARKTQQDSPIVKATKTRSQTRTTKKRDQQSQMNNSQSASEENEMEIIRTKSWCGLLRHRMAPGGFFKLVQSLIYEQWSAIVDVGFGGMMSIRTKLIPKPLARWLLERYDPWDNSLNLANGKLHIDKEDVHATLGLPMGDIEVNEGCTSEGDIHYLEDWRRRWHIERGGPPIGSMDEVIIAHGGHGQEFITDFVTYAISTCIAGNANGTCNFRVVKYLRRTDQIKHYNWCKYTIRCLNDAVVEWKRDKTKFFTGSLLFLMLFYLDRVEFRARTVERPFPVAIEWDTNKVRSRDKDEQESGGYGKGRILDRIDYQKIEGIQSQNEEPIQITSERPRTEARCPFCTHCNEPDEGGIEKNDNRIEDDIPEEGQAQEENIMQDTQNQQTPINPVEEVHGDNVVEDCDSPNDTYFCSPEFLEQVDKLESIAREQIKQKKRFACSPPSFSLGIALDLSQTPTVHPPTDMHEQGKTENSAPNNETGMTSTHQPNERNEGAVTTYKATEGTKQPERPAPMQKISKGQQIIKRHQPKRMLTKVPLQCRSPYLKDYKEARQHLTPQQLLLVDYAFLPSDKLHPPTEKLFEYDSHDEDTKLWVFREAFETLAGQDRDLDKSIVDVLCLILNWMERLRNPMTKKRMFFSTNVFLAIVSEQGDPMTNFKTVMELERRRYNWLKLGEAQLVLFPILQDNHFFLLGYDFRAKKIIVLDNRLEEEDSTPKYKHSAMALTNLFAKYLVTGRLKKGIDVRKFSLVLWNLAWQDNINMHDCGIYAIRHMEAFHGAGVKYWSTGFEKNKEKFITQLRSRYATMILESELNQVRLQVEEAAKEGNQEIGKIVQQLE